MSSMQALFFPDDHRNRWDRPPSLERVVKQAEHGRAQQQKAIEAERRHMSLRTIGDDHRVRQRLSVFHRLEVMRREGGKLAPASTWPPRSSAGCAPRLATARRSDLDPRWTPGAVEWLRGLDLDFVTFSTRRG